MKTNHEEETCKKLNPERHLYIAIFQVFHPTYIYAEIEVQTTPFFYNRTQLILFFNWKNISRNIRGYNGGFGHEYD